MIQSISPHQHAHKQNQCPVHVDLLARPTQPDGQGCSGLGHPRFHTGAGAAHAAPAAGYGVMSRQRA